MVHAETVTEDPPQSIHHAVVVEQVAELLAPLQKSRRRFSSQLGGAATEPGLFRRESRFRKTLPVDKTVQTGHFAGGQNVLQDQVAVQIEKVFLDRVVVHRESSSQVCCMKNIVPTR